MASNSVFISGPALPFPGYREGVGTKPPTGNAEMRRKDMQGET